MKIAVFGSTGFIGKKLKSKAEEKGYIVVPLDIRKNIDWKEQLKDCDAVVNLAGHQLFKDRWNDRIKALIYDSRIEGTHAIVQALAGTKVKVLVNASAIGIYGSGTQDCHEESPHADDFLARVCKAWEAEALAAQRLYKIRTVCARFGIVLGKEGGALAQMLLPFKLGLGGPIASGKQKMSWIHIEDAVGLILHALENENVSGAMNVTAPEIVSNKEFSNALGKALHRPAFLPVPKLGLYVLVGEAAGVIASGQRAIPQKALESGYKFQYKNISSALEAIF
jgi:uncharacterized protein (TIGR01777 family)